MMQDICSTAADRRGLLVKVWRLFGRLWDSSLQVVFDSEVLSLGADRERALQQVTFLQRELEAVNDENRLIRSKVNEMVNHALTRSHQDQTSMENTTVLQSELNKTKKVCGYNTLGLLSPSARMAIDDQASDYSIRRRSSSVHMISDGFF